jgi:hypothetical protein
MRKLMSLRYSLDLLNAIIAAAAVLGVVQSFVIGRHSIIPTAILAIAILFGNLARHGFRDQAWAKHIAFWIGVLFTCHLFFALFWSVRYRAILGEAFEPVAGAATAILVFLVYQYGSRNVLFR